MRIKVAMFSTVYNYCAVLLFPNARLCFVKQYRLLNYQDNDDVKDTYNLS